MAFLVTGCGRSGTNYTSVLLNACGVLCGHEAVFYPTTTTPQWGSWQAEASWLAVPHLGTLSKELPIYHQVRNPLEVLRSFLGFKFFSAPFDDAGHGPYLRAIQKHDPAIFSFADPLHRAMMYWIRWNQAAEAHSCMTYRVEDLDARSLEQLCGEGLDPEKVAHALASTSRRSNGRKRDENLGWSNIPQSALGTQLRDMAERYGYAVE
jgi:hypothetical protein